MKKINVNIDEDSWGTTPVPSSILGIPNQENFNLIEVLIHIGMVTRHPEDYGININTYWAFLRYVNCFKEGEKFKLNKKWEDVDSHQKTILSDDFGMGFASYLLTKYMDIIAIVDTGFFLKYLPSLLGLNKKSKRGPSKTPDFILLDSSGDLHILECKGTQTSINRLEKQLDDGKEQVDNLNDSGGIISEKLVTGIFIPQFNSTEKAYFKIIDPEFSLDFADVKKEEVVVRCLQGQLAKELQMVDKREWGNYIANIKDLKAVNLEHLFEEFKINDVNLDCSKKFHSDGYEWEVKFHTTIFKKMSKNRNINLYDFLLSNIKREIKVAKNDKSKKNQIEVNSVLGLIISVSGKN
ncbi:hypothetical protein OCA90_26815 [Bacillus cereus]|nr:hypothetical protein [Bacillus cereus]